MENLKIHVKNEAESKEAQELFFKLGYEWYSTKKKIDDTRKHIYADSDGDLTYSTNGKQGGGSFKEITLQELRKMTTPQHKEYLDPRNNYELIEWDGGFMIQDHWIEVPVGAEALSLNGDGEGLIFWKNGFNYVVDIDKHWDKAHSLYADFKSQYPLAASLWQRDTQPSAMNADSKVYSSADELFASASLESTLAERQSTYGDFRDVANTTGQLMGILRNSKNGHTLPYMHEEALHMICSKMARLVNGDPSHKDSWHDIAGYAKLVEDSL